jgi:ribA/ribD-fused uncharacterized protein
MCNTDEKFFENDAGVYFKSGYPSQWFSASFVLDGNTYNCCEQRMMHAKATYFGDIETAERIMLEKEPKEQKKLGRLVKNFDDEKWNTVADQIVYEANVAKFSQNSELKALLLATNDKQFVECSPYDKIWGNGLDITTTLATPQHQWEGTNRLGKAIMRARETLRSMD